MTFEASRPLRPSKQHPPHPNPVRCFRKDSVTANQCPEVSGAHYLASRVVAIRDVWTGRRVSRRVAASRETLPHQLRPSAAFHVTARPPVCPAAVAAQCTSCFSSGYYHYLIVCQTCCCYRVFYLFILYTRCDAASCWVCHFCEMLVTKVPCTGQF